MPQDAWQATLAKALHPQRVHRRQLPQPQEHPRVLRRLRESLQATRKKGKRLWVITPSPAQFTDTTSPPRKRRRTDNNSTGTSLTHSTPGTPRATQHEAPDPPATAPPPDPTGSTSWVTPGSSADDTRYHRRPPNPEAPTPGREPIRFASHKAVRAGAARTHPNQA